MSVMRYKQKPPEVEAFQFTGGQPNATQLVNWVLNNGGTAVWLDAQEPIVAGDGSVIPGRDEMIRVMAPTTVMNANKGDYVVFKNGTFMVSKQVDFEQAYELVEGHGGSIPLTS